MRSPASRIWRIYSSRSDGLIAPRQSISAKDETVRTALASIPNHVLAGNPSALALKAIEWDISFDDEAALMKLAGDSQIRLEPSLGGNRVLIDGRDVSARVREADVTEAASRVSVHPQVRAWMVDAAGRGKPVSLPPASAFSFWPTYAVNSVRRASL